MLPETRSYYVRGEDGVEYGPADLPELREWVRENRAGIDTSVRRDAPLAPWLPWQEHAELVALLAEAHAGVRTDLVPAPLLPRLLAGIADIFLAYILFSPILFAAVAPLPDEVITQWAYWFFNKSGPNPVPFAFQAGVELSWQLVFVLYFAGFHALHGRTPAKSILQLRVVDAAGRKPTFVRALLRGLALSISVFFLLGFPLTYALLNPQRRTFHDFVAGTYVVKK